jgi:hypothetical protein
VVKAAFRRNCSVAHSICHNLFRQQTLIANDPFSYFWVLKRRYRYGRDFPEYRWTNGQHFWQRLLLGGREEKKK